MSKKAIVFDFDGTMADTAAIILDIYNEIAQHRKWKQVSPSDYKHLRKSKASFWKIVLTAGIRPWNVPGLLKEGRRRFLVHTDTVTFFPGLEATVRKLHADGWDLYVLSSNSNKAIRRALTQHKLENHMHILARPMLFRKSRSLKRLARAKNYDPDNVWMIGDEVRDMKAAEKAGVRSIAVSWGLQHVSLLKECNPTASATRPEDIYLIVSGRS